MKLLSVPELASKFGLSASQVRQLIKSAKLRKSFLPVHAFAAGRSKLRIVEDEFAAAMIMRGTYARYR
jgi:hypothetical protein